MVIGCLKSGSSRVVSSATPDIVASRTAHADGWRSRIDVAEVLDAWLAPDYRYFKLRSEDGDSYFRLRAVGRR